MMDSPGPAPARDFWRGRRVLLTGHTGFKGSWLSAWLVDLGADVLGLSLPEHPPGPQLWESLGLKAVHEIKADIVSHGWQDEVVAFEPEIVFHLAAQSLVSRGYTEPFRTFATNVQGSVQLLQVLSRLASTRAAVMVTSDKVYDPDQPIPFTEASYLGGRDPYSASKAAMELVVQSWPTLPFPVATARAGNVIGGGDTSADRLLPDLIRSWSTGTELRLRRPTAIRPWQHVLEPLRGYLLYAEQLVAADPPRSLNLGPDASQCVPVESVVSFAAEHWADVEGLSTGPHWSVDDEAPMNETEALVIDSRLAREALGWSSVLDWRASVRKTLDWHRARSLGASAHELVTAEIAEYTVALIEVA